MPETPNNVDVPPPLLAIGVLSGALLAYEVLLTRLLSIVHWHHLAFMVISLALLGFGASGTFLFLFRRRLVERYQLTFTINALLFSIAAPVCFLAARAVPFNMLEILLDPWQWAGLFVIYTILAVPFLFGANCIGLTFIRFPLHIPRTYGADLLGAGLGALAVVGFMYILLPGQILLWVSAAGLATVMLVNRRRCPLLATIGIAGVVLIAAAFHPAWLRVQPNEFKDLSQALRMPGSVVVAQRASPLGVISVVDSPRVPFRYAPGLNLMHAQEPPPQLGLFVDGDSAGVITRGADGKESLAFLDGMTSALPYHLTSPVRVLVLGAGGGAEILQALEAGAGQVDAVELNGQLVELVTDTYAEFTGWPAIADKVKVHTTDVRGYVAGTRERFDVIQMGLLDSFGVSGTGLRSLGESYLYTTEALQSYLERLAEGGLLAITRWVRVPPRDMPRLFNTAIHALRTTGVENPGQRLALIRSWNTATLLIKNGAFDGRETGVIRRFAKTRGFDVGWYPGMVIAEANRFNQLDQPRFYQAASALLGPDADRFVRAYKFDIRSTADDRPYHFQFFRWTALPEFLSLWQRGGVALLEQGYPILIVTLLQAAVASLVLILVPLWVMRRDRSEGGVPTARVALYFLCLGLAFMFIELSFIQKFLLFLHHPVYAVAVVLAGFLVFAGAGSLVCRRWLARGWGGGKPMAPVVGLLVVLALLDVWALSRFSAAMSSLPDLLRVGGAVLLIAPLAFCMGMPFPAGLARLEAHRTAAMVPWAWGINGCASVVGVVLGMLLAVHLGFTALVMLALGLYVLAVLVSW